MLLQLEYSIDIGQLTLKNVARIYPDYMQKCAGPVLFTYEHPINYYCCNPHNSGKRLPWISFFIDVGMPLCHYADAGYYKSPFHLNS